MKIILTRPDVQNQCDGQIGVAEFSETKAGVKILRGDFLLDNNVPIRVEGNFDPRNSTISLFVFVRDEQIILLMTKWDAIAPYLGFSAHGTGWLQLFFQKDEKDHS